MRYAIEVTWITMPTRDLADPHADLAEPIRRPTPTFYVEARDVADARSQVASVLAFPMNAYVDVKPAAETELTPGEIELLAALLRAADSYVAYGEVTTNPDLLRNADEDTLIAMGDKLTDLFSNATAVRVVWHVFDGGEAEA